MGEHPGKGLVTGGIEDAEVFERSPFIQGFLAGVKGAIVGAPLGMMAGALHGEGKLVGGLAGAAAGALVAGTSKAISQDLHNKVNESILRYHANRLRGREPFFFMPPPTLMGRLFNRMHAEEHARVHREG